jgi:hypothetical protein
MELCYCRRQGLLGRSDAVVPAKKVECNSELAQGVNEQQENESNDSE